MCSKLCYLVPHLCQYRLSAGKGPENCHNLKETGFRRGLFIEVIAEETLKESN